MVARVTEIVERELGVTLPEAYCDLLEAPPSFIQDPGSDCYLWLTSESLLRENDLYRLNPEDLSDIENSSLLSRVRRYFLYGSKDKILNHRRHQISLWVEPKRFKIGSDGGECEYFIHLDDKICAVWEFDMETNNMSQRWHSLASFVKYIESIEKDDT